MKRGEGQRPEEAMAAEITREAAIALLREIKQQPILLDWNGIINMQITCLKNGINRVGVPDLMIAQNAIQESLTLLSAAKHFSLMADHMPLALYR
jgi:hypothetical protein